MTFIEMHNLLDELLDKAGGVYFTPVKKDYYLNLAQNEFVDDRYSAFEINDMYREDLAPLVKIFTNSATDTINITSITDFRYALAVSGVFNETDWAGNSTPNFETYVQPRKLDDYYKNLHNTFNLPSTHYPVYIQYKNGGNTILQIKCGSSTPVNLQLFYLKIPTAIDGTNNPSNTADLPANTHEKIVNLAVRKMLGVIESPRVQDQQMELTQQK